jgi:hypothetical protein
LYDAKKNLLKDYANLNKAMLMPAKNLIYQLIDAPKEYQGKTNNLIQKDQDSFNKK